MQLRGIFAINYDSLFVIVTLTIAGLIIGSILKYTAMSMTGDIQTAGHSQHICIERSSVRAVVTILSEHKFLQLCNQRIV